MNGFDVVAELDTEGVRRVVRAFWRSKQGDAGFQEFEKEVTAVHRVWPPLAPGEAPEDGLALWVRYKATRTGFPMGNPFGLESGERVDAALYASGLMTAEARVWFAVTLEARVELRYPGELGAFRKLGDFVLTEVSAIAMAEAAVSRASGGGEDRLLIDPRALVLKDVWFFNNARPAPQVADLVNRLLAQLIPILVPQPIPVAMRIDQLGAGAQIALARAPEVNFRSFAGSQEVTGQLAGEDRFRPGVRTIVVVGLGFGFAGQAHRNPGRLSDRSPQLLAKSDHLALALSAWVYHYFERVHLETMIRRAFNDGIIKQAGEQAQDPSQPLRHTSPYGWAMFRVTENPKGFTKSDDDNVIILHSVGNLTLQGGVLRTRAVIQQIQRGLFGLDFLSPDVDGNVHAAFKIEVETPGQAEDKYTMLKPVLQGVVQFERTDSWLEQVVGVLLSVQDLFSFAVTAIADFVADGDFDEQTKNAGVNFLISVGMIFAPFLVLFAQIIDPRLFGNLIGPVGVPSINFFGTDKLITLLFKTPPTPVGPVPGKPFDDGLTVYAQLRIN